MPLWIVMPDGFEDPTKDRPKAFCLIGVPPEEIFPDRYNDLGDFPEYDDVVTLPELIACKWVEEVFGEEPYEVHKLPYSAQPAYDYKTCKPIPSAEAMFFCMSPDHCKGRTSCPRSPACTE